MRPLRQAEAQHSLFDEVEQRLLEYLSIQLLVLVAR